MKHLYTLFTAALIIGSFFVPREIYGQYTILSSINTAIYLYVNYKNNKKMT